ncbi:hypothetical protein [Vagococcus acidifermentans]|uniref:hypothetical protein n=1 Tax=Vagococcus acidifermentans TaxID=564710 RepID=UPI001476BDF1|nr:hypothetical protein [Vagococcus acidifermentans]
MKLLYVFPKAGEFDLVSFDLRDLRTNWLIVGIDSFLLPDSLSSSTHPGGSFLLTKNNAKIYIASIYLNMLLEQSARLKETCTQAPLKSYHNLISAVNYFYLSFCKKIMVLTIFFPFFCLQLLVNETIATEAQNELETNGRH